MYGPYIRTYGPYNRAYGPYQGAYMDHSTTEGTTRLGLVRPIPNSYDPYPNPRGPVLTA